MDKFKGCEMETHLLPSKDRKVTRLSTVHEDREVNKERGYIWRFALCLVYSQLSSKAALTYYATIFVRKC